MRPGMPRDVAGEPHPIGLASRSASKSPASSTDRLREGLRGFVDAHLARVRPRLRRRTQV